MSRRDPPEGTPDDIELLRIDKLSTEALLGIDADKARTLIGLMSEEDNVELCRLAHDELGVSNVVARVASQEAAAASQSAAGSQSVSR